MCAYIKLPGIVLSKLIIKPYLIFGEPSCIYLGTRRLLNNKAQAAAVKFLWEPLKEVRRQI